MPNYWPQQQQWPGSSSCSVRECGRSRIRSVAAYRSVAASGNVAGAASGALQRTGALQRPGTLLECCRGRIRDVARVCYVDRVPGLLQGSDLLCYRDVAGACLVAKNVRFPA